MISPYDFLTVKSKTEAEQRALVEGFASQRIVPAKSGRLHDLVEEKFPLPHDVDETGMMRLWGLAIWMSDIGTVLSKDLRKLYLEDLDKILADLKIDRRLIVSMSGQADRAISILSE